MKLARRALDRHLPFSITTNLDQIGNVNHSLHGLLTGHHYRTLHLAILSSKGEQRIQPDPIT
jgi:hypothetical protein